MKRENPPLPPFGKWDGRQYNSLALCQPSRGWQGHKHGVGVYDSLTGKYFRIYKGVN